MENTVNVLSHPTVLTAIFVGAGLLILVYILKLIRKDERVVVQKTKNDTFSHSTNRKEATQSSKTKKKVFENRWNPRNEKVAYNHPWLVSNLKGHSGRILSIDYSSNGKYLASCCDEDPDSGNLTSSESSSSSESLNSSTTSRKTMDSRNTNSLSRRQRKNRRKTEVAPTHSSPTKKCKSLKNDKNSSSTATEKQKRNVVVQIKLPLRRVDPAAANIEVMLRKYLVTYDDLHLEGFPMRMLPFGCSGAFLEKYYNCLPVYFLYDRNNKLKTKKMEARRESTPGSDTGSDSGRSSETNSDCEGNAASLPPFAYYPIETYAKWSQTKQTLFQRTCCRCRSLFYTTHTEYVTSESCVYHWGRLQASGVENKCATVYSCCNKVESSLGCTKCSLHVWSGTEQGFNGPFEDYLSTEGERFDPSSGFGVYALDCEMSYTVRGLDCTRVTLVDVRCQVVYDTFVKPDFPVVDYNTRFSGVTAELLRDFGKPLRQVQHELLEFIDQNTVLIGHGLENDLKALRMVHYKIVDTAHVFPHFRGLPFKRPLKHLAQTFLRKDIQNGSMGHDSSEDASVCMELMRWRLHRDQTYEN